MKDFTKDYYHSLKGVYFSKILRTIIELGALDRRDVRVLDYGCGTGRLSKMLPDKVIGYDIVPGLTEIIDWRKAQFDVVVANEVFYLLSAGELTGLLRDFRSINPDLELLVGISRQSLLNNLLKFVAGEPDAHADTRLKPEEERTILCASLDTLN